MDQRPTPDSPKRRSPVPSNARQALAERVYKAAFAVGVEVALLGVDGDTAEDIGQNFAVKLYDRVLKGGAPPADMRRFAARTVWRDVVAYHEALHNRKRPFDRYENKREREQREWMQPEAEYDLRVTEDTLRQAMEALPDGQRRLVELTVLDGLSYAEAAQECGITVGTVRTQMGRAIRTLRRALLAPREERK